MEKRTIKRDNVARHLVEYELNMVGKTLLDTLDVEEWYKEFTMTQAQHDEFKKYAIGLIKKVFKCNTARAEKTFSWFDLGYGLRIKG